MAVIEAARGISRDLGATRWPAVWTSEARRERQPAGGWADCSSKARRRGTAACRVDGFGSCVYSRRKDLASPEAKSEREVKAHDGCSTNL
jgi:hypothetical protein